MKKLINIVLTCVLTVSLLSVSFVSDTFAAGGLSITSSASSVSSGGTFTVTVKASNTVFVEGLKLTISSGSGTIVSGLGKSSLDKGESTSAKIKLTGDSVTVKVTGTSASYETETEQAASASVTVKKKKTTNTNTPGGNSGGNTTTTTKSKDNNLSSLTVSSGTLSPEFKSSTTSYTVNLDGNATKITLSAKANHSKAKVSGIGEKNLKVGNNSFDIKCTAENGSVKTYKVNVYVDETPLVYTTYKDKKLGVVRNTDSIGVPSTFEAKTITLEGQEVKGYYSSQFNKTIIYLSDENHVKNFYIYDDNQGIVSIFKPLSLLGRNLYIVDLKEEETIKEDMTYQEIEIDGQKLMGWVYNNPAYSNYKMFTAMNEFGEMVVYQHEKTENSLQIYLEEVPVIDESEKKEEKGSYETIFMATTGFFAFTTLVVFVIHLRFKKKSIASIKAYYEKRNQE